MNQMSIPEPNNSLDNIHQNKKQPNLQIAIMKAIALNGAMTKPKLAKMLDSKSTSIATTITKDSDTPEPLRIFRKSTEFELIKSIQQPIFQLTDFGMTMLLVSHFRKVDKKGIQQPILNRKELSKLLSIFKQKHSDNYIGVKIDMILEYIVHQYLLANPTICDELVVGIKGNSQLQDLETEIDLNKSEILKLESGIAKLNIANRKTKAKIVNILSKEMILKLKK